MERPSQVSTQLPLGRTYMENCRPDFDLGHFPSHYSDVIRREGMMIIYASDFQFLLRQVHCYTCLSIGKMLRLDDQHNEPLKDHLHRWAINYSYTSLVLLELRTQSRAIFRQQLARSHLNRKHHSCSDPLIVVSTTKARWLKLDGCRTETGAGWMRLVRPLELFSDLLAPSPTIQVKCKKDCLLLSGLRTRKIYNIKSFGNIAQI